MGDIYGLIFDIDGVIADTEAVNSQATIRVFEEMFGVSGVTRPDFDAGIGRGAQAYILAAAKIHGLAISQQELEKAEELRERYITELFIKEPRTFEGVLELIDAALEADNFKAAIATSSSRKISQILLKSIGVPYQRMVYITGDMVKRKKPDPELFLLAAKGLKIAPADCVVIEDAPSGVEAAKAAGCKCIAITNTTAAENLFGADLIINSLTETDLEKITALINS
ncbi:MAG: HAD family phosphatase [Phycisphaerae bacterium]